MAVRVTLVGGQVDTFLYTHQTDTALRCGALEFKGLFGYWSELNGKPRAMLTGEDRKAVYRVTGVEKDRIMLDRPVADGDFPDVDGDGRRMVRIYDFGPSDEAAIHQSIFRTFAIE